jgi:peptidoglycan LD-endopeptidase CwlK
MKRIVHSNDLIQCMKCAELVSGCHPKLAQFLWDVRKEFPTAHISCGYRSPTDQDKAFEAGTSKARAGQSPHNVVIDHRPMSLALDFFELRNGQAFFESAFYFRIWSEMVEGKRPWIDWGGNWKQFPDRPHFQVKDWRNFAALIADSQGTPLQ